MNIDTVESDSYRQGRGLIDMMDWQGMRQEVAEESRAEVIFIGKPGCGKSSLYARLHRMAYFDDPSGTPALDDLIQPERFGLFTLVDLPGTQTELPLDIVATASLLVYLLDGQHYADAPGTSITLDPVDRKWIARLHATGLPVMLIVTKVDCWRFNPTHVLQALETQIGEPVLPMSIDEDTGYCDAVLKNLVALCPQLAVPLGREVPQFRKHTAQGIILRTALSTGLVSLEPIPFLDLPVQLGAQVGMVARIATMYGHMPTHDYCKELVLTAAGGAILKTGAQQIVKAVPVVGWLASGVLSGLTTVVVGETALAVFERELTLERAKTFAARTWRACVYSPVKRILAWVGKMSQNLRGAVNKILNQGSLLLRECWPFKPRQREV